MSSVDIDHGKEVMFSVHITKQSKNKILEKKATVSGCFGGGGGV